MFSFDGRPKFHPIRVPRVLTPEELKAQEVRAAYQDELRRLTYVARHSAPVATRPGVAAPNVTVRQKDLV